MNPSLDRPPFERTVRSGLKLVEVPITFVERSLGASKMSNAIVREALWRVTQWGISSRLPNASKSGLGKPGSGKP